MGRFINAGPIFIHARIKMSLITPKGSPTAPVYVIVEDPYPQDSDKGYIFSAGLGYVFDRMMHDAGLKDYYVLARRPDPEHRDTYAIVESTINQFRPPFIIPLGDSLGHFYPEARKKQAKKGSLTPEERQADMGKYAGSLLTSGIINYPHYICSTLPPDILVRQWDMRDVCTHLDLGKIRSELDYYLTHNHTLEPLPIYNFEYNFDEPGGFSRLMDRLDYYANQKLLSVDIESIYTNKKSIYWPHPGYPVTIGVASDAQTGISFELFREDRKETISLWRRIDSIFRCTPLLGQNFFDFDAPRLNALGIDIPYGSISDTLIRHHILWPELPHKLQFQTRQYTRQPYYKDEGHGWNLKDLKKLKRYNCLDVCVTYEIYEKQEEEFNERPHLR